MKKYRFSTSIKALLASIPLRYIFRGIFLIFFLIILYAPPLEYYLNQIKKGLDDYLMRAGIKAESVTISGAHYVKESEIIYCLGWDSADETSLFFYDLEAPSACLKAHPWVKSVKLYKKYPSHLFVMIEEKKPFARYQHNGKLYVIEEDGKIIKQISSKEFQHLKSFVGFGANLHAKRLLTELEAFPKINKMTRALSWVGKRRWDLHLTNAMLIKMPERNFRKGLQRLDTLNNLGSLLDRKVRAIDLRLEGKVIIDSKYQGKFEY